MGIWSTQVIDVGATKSEWKEIKAYFISREQYWDGMEFDFLDEEKEISFSAKNAISLWESKEMMEMSKSYPSVTFKYFVEYEYGDKETTWICNGKTGSKKEMLERWPEQIKEETKRFIQARPNAARGISHSIKLHEDGHVTAEGENRFGECDVNTWSDIIQVSCGNWHTVGLKNDGRVVACGSNVNGQCDVSDIKGKAVAVSCGRYHTAVLLDNGKVVVKGEPENQASEAGQADSVPADAIDFPMVCEVGALQEANDRIESMKVGEKIILKKEKSYPDRIYLQAFSEDGIKLGNVHSYEAVNRTLCNIIKDLNASVASVTPLSKRSSRAMYALLDIRLERTSNTKDVSTAETIGAYKRTKFYIWPQTRQILSIYDATIGITDDKRLFIDGFCPFSENDLCEMAGIEKSSANVENQEYMKRGMPDEEEAALIAFLHYKEKIVKESKKEAEEWLKLFGENIEKNPKIEFAGKAFAFTGLVGGIGVRDEKEHPVAKEIIKRGGMFRQKVSGKTDYLVVMPERAGYTKVEDAIYYIEEENKDIHIILLDDLLKKLEK